MYSRLYPRDFVPQDDLAFNYNLLGRFDKALDHARIGLILEPNSADLRGEAAFAYEGLSRLADAKAIVEDGLPRVPDNWNLRLALSNIALAQGDDPAREKADTALRQNPEGTPNLLYQDAALAASRGRLREAEYLFGQARTLALKLGLKDNAAYAFALQAVAEGYLEKPALARANAKKALGMSQMMDLVVSSAWALALSGDDQEARELVRNLAGRRPDDAMIHFVWVPGIEALASLRHGDPEHAIEVLGPAAQYDRSTLDSLFIRADSYLRANQSAEVVAECARILALKGKLPSDPICSLAELGLARAYALSGDKANSLAAYQKFLALWKNADPDSPILRQAKAEYAKMR